MRAVEIVAVVDLNDANGLVMCRLAAEGDVGAVVRSVCVQQRWPRSGIERGVRNEPVA